MKRICACLICLLGAWLASTAKEGLEISYIEMHRDVEEQPVPAKYYWHLRTDGDRSSFVWIQDSLAPKGFGTFDGPYEVWKNVRKENELVFKGNCRDLKLYYAEPVPEFDWEILPGDTMICDYPCQKAQTTFRGKTWIVWFTLDIPYSDGPWKLCGLPGLILKAEDTKKDYLYSAYAIKQVQIDKWNLTTRSYIRTTPSSYASKVIQAYKDVMTSGMRILPDGSMEISSKNVKPDPKTACLYEYFDDNKK